MSIRQKIEDALQTTPNISLDELRKQLPDIKPGSLKAEFYKLRRKLFGPVKTEKKSVQQQVSEYLNKNPEASIDTLLTAFSEIKKTSLSTYKSVWKKTLEPNKQEKPTAKQPDKPATKKKQLNKIAKPAKKTKKSTVKLAKHEKKKDKPVKATKLDKPAKKSDTELIQSLKETIAAQEKTIQTMNRSIEILNPESDAELKGLTLSEIKRVAVTYLKSIKELQPIK
jgi:hypothetical protein